MFTTRITWADLPDAIRERCEALLGTAVLISRSQTGGFSPGVADRLELADGARAFLKAVHPDLNAGSARLTRREARVNALLPRDVPAPRLRHTFELDDWVVLIFDDVDGRQPSLPWTEEDYRITLDAFATLGRVPAAGLDLPPASALLADDYLGFARLLADPDPGLDPWLADNLADLDELTRASASAVTGDTLCLLDGRADNILIAQSRAWLLDWPWACLGAPWLDVAMLASSACFQGASFDVEAITDAWVTDHGGSPARITGVFLGMLSYLADAACRPPDPSLPALRVFHRTSRDALVPVVRGRLERGLV